MTTAADVFEEPAPRRRLVGHRVVIVEDHRLLALSLRLALTAEGADVHAVDLRDRGGADDVVDDCLHRRPDVVLLDLDLGEAGDGAAMIAPLAAAGVRVVVVTGSTDRARLGECLEAGAVGLIEKVEDLDRLVDQVRLAAVGEPLVPAQRRLDLLTECRRQRAARHRQLAPFEALTGRECEVLAALVRGRRVDEVGHELHVGEATARTHVRAILRKLGVKSQLAAVARAREAGWQEKEPARPAPRCGVIRRRGRSLVGAAQDGYLRPTLRAEA